MKKVFFKGISILGFLLLLAINAHAQARSDKKGWVFDKTVDGVDFYHKITNCEGNKLVFLKFENKNAFNVTVSWKETFIVEQEERFRTKNSGKSERFSAQKSLVLSPGIMFESDCLAAKHMELVARPIPLSPADETEVMQFSFMEIKVSR
jgi:hypothetical protein